MSMLTNYFKIAWRNLVKRKFYTLLNVAGLGLGIACSVLIYLFISFHLSFDSYHEKSNRTFRVVNDILFEETLHEKGASMAMYNALSSGASQITDAAVMLSKYTFTITVNKASATEARFKEDKNVALVSAEWFNIFDYKWLAGNPEALVAPNTVALTEKQARKYFGTADVMGKILTFDNRQPVKVVGLISDSPSNTDLKADLFVSLSSLKNLQPDIPERFFNDWGYINSSTSLYISLKDETKKSEVEALISDMRIKHMGNIASAYRFKLQPLNDVHFNSQYGGAIQKPLLTTLTIIGVLILLIASVNYVNLSIAQQARRSVEIGTRKVLGGTTRQLFLQFICETFLITALAMLLALLLVAIILPLANKSLFALEPISLISYANTTLFLIGVFLILILLSGVYPAVILSRLNVFSALEGKSGTWRAGFSSKFLVIAQNAIAHTLIICTLVMVLQVRFLKNTDMGFDREALVLLPLPASGPKNDVLSRKLDAMPQVASFSFCFNSPSSRDYGGGSVQFDNREWEKWPANSKIGDTSYVKSFGLQMVAGRNYRELKAANEFLINESMVTKLGLKNPEEAIGKPLVIGEFENLKGTIVGVLKDFTTASMLTPIGPVVVTNHPAKFQTVAVKLKSGNFQDAIRHINESWEEAYPGEVFEYQFFDDQIDKLYKKEDLQQKLISVATSAAIVLSCLGLLGLISLITLQRTKEIGIRKVLGASVAGIVNLLTSDFLKLVLMALFIASPIAWWAMNNWLQNFAYRIEIEWWIFGLAGCLALLIALATVGFQALKAAVANPVKSLRTE